MDLARAVRTIALEQAACAAPPQEEEDNGWSAFSAGAMVEIQGIRARPGLNGQHGRVIQFVPGKDRYRVEMLSKEVVSVRKLNIRPVCGVPQSSQEIKVGAKDRGNCCFRRGDFSKAVEEFSVALLHDAGDHVIFSNRSGAYARLGQFLSLIHI
eukprot:TRINITY_DN2607_c0_g1_i3.p1 TRINITY_DN2607_c0_g1~~TRINITY_DN2607_c0_g1_i3.p1  ORF type:complete len:154 (-),score=34.36 TRINITY_DN2607_c0_g1_i3:161-622(-)